MCTANAHHARRAHPRSAIVVGVLMQCCTAYMAVLLVQEVSTPFVNARKLGRMGFCCVGRRREAELAACIGVTFFVSRCDVPGTVMQFGSVLLV